MSSLFLIILNDEFLHTLQMSQDLFFTPKYENTARGVIIFLDLTSADSHTYRTSQRWFHLDDQNEPHIQGTYGAYRNIHLFLFCQLC